jgi:hypothetical protein
MAEDSSPRLENGSLVVQVGGDGRLSVTDKRTGMAWHQVEMPLAGQKLENPQGQPRRFEVDSARRKLRVGTEAGIDSYLPYLHWLETQMSLVRWTVGSKPLPGWEPVLLKPDGPAKWPIRR